jgi:hypothetical protein
MRIARPRFLSAVLLAAVAMVAGAISTVVGPRARKTVYASAASDPLLRWAPPALTDPTTISLTSGLDPDHLVLSKAKDYVLKMPAGGIHGTVEIDGGHNVVLIGGSVTVPSSANQADNGRDDTDTAIYITGSTGTVHIEGVAIGADPNVMYDGIDVNAPGAIVQVENVRMTNVWGSANTEHADVIQTWGGVKALRVDRLTANGDYQGLTIKPDLGLTGLAQLDDIDLTLDSPPPALASSTESGGYMLWLTADGCDSTPTQLTSVYVEDLNPHIAPSNTVWPPTQNHVHLPCAGQLTGDSMSWPLQSVTGSVVLGAPAPGSFVPPGVAGMRYRSPGYQTIPSPS